MLSSKGRAKEQLAGLMGDVKQKKLFQRSSLSQDLRCQMTFGKHTFKYVMATEYGEERKLGPVQYEGNHAMNPGHPRQISLTSSYSLAAD